LHEGHPNVDTGLKAAGAPDPVRFAEASKEQHVTRVIAPRAAFECHASAIV
jgi:hypothetical protein